VPCITKLARSSCPVAMAGAPAVTTQCRVQHPVGAPRLWWMSATRALTESRRLSRFDGTRYLCSQ
jgi:hypothetical protein